jgi:hypothetical protein
MWNLNLIISIIIFIIDLQMTRILYHDHVSVFLVKKELLWIWRGIQSYQDVNNYACNIRK